MRDLVHFEGANDIALFLDDTLREVAPDCGPAFNFKPMNLGLTARNRFTGTFNPKVARSEVSPVRERFSFPLSESLLTRMKICGSETFFLALKYCASS